MEGREGRGEEDRRKIKRKWRGKGRKEGREGRGGKRRGVGRRRRDRGG